MKAGSFSSNLWVTMGLLCSLITVGSLFVRSERRIAAAQKDGFQAYIIANQTRQSWVSPAIMESPTGNPHDDYMVWMDRENAAKIQSAQSMVKIMRSLILLICAGLLYMTFRTMRTLHNILGGSVDQVRDTIDKARKYDESLICQSEEKWRSLFSLLPQGVSIVGPDGNITDMNPALEKILDITHEGLLAGAYRKRQYLRPNLTPMSPMEFPSYRVIHEQKPILKVELGVVKENGEIIWVEISATPLDFPDAKCLVVTTDITQCKRDEMDLLDAKTTAETADRVKGEFLASMSHEIRTPMNGVIGLTQLLSMTQLDGEQRDLVETIKTSGDSMMAVLNDILDFSKMQAGMFHIEKKHFHPMRAIMDVVDLLVRQAHKKGIALEVYHADNLPNRLFSDPGRVRQILGNLIGNAVKFTSQGKVEVRVMEENSWLRIEIADTGPGIPLDKHGLMFQKFSQADATLTRKFGGTGLGLAISKRLVELLDGEIGFDSEPGRGSCFWFRLPMELAPSGDRDWTPNVNVAELSESGAWPRNPENFLGMRVLLVEDNLVNQKVATGMLKKMGCKIDIAENGLKAVEMAFKGEYTIILMDCDMPEMDGLEATREIRRKEAELAMVPGGTREHRLIVALTANAMSEDEGRCLDSGMDGFLAKPLKLEALAKALGEISVT